MTEARSQYNGIKLLVLGEPGTGKTTAIKSILEAGLKPRGIFTEPGHAVVSRNKEIRFKYIQPAPPGWDMLEDLATTSNSLTAEAIKKISFPKDTHSQFFKVLSACRRFVDDTGEDFGPIEEWGTDVCFFFDSLTGLVAMCRGLAVGNKPALTWPEYDVVQQNVLQFINKIWTGLRCHVYITAHVDLIRDDISGGNRLMAHTIGKAISPVIHVNATDAVLATRAKTDFHWSASGVDAMVKAQHMPMTGESPQDFNILLARWKELGGVIE